MINTPCLNDPPGQVRRYSDFVYQQLTLPAAQSGVNTSGAYACTNVTYVAPSPSVGGGGNNNNGGATTGGGGATTGGGSGGNQNNAIVPSGTVTGSDG
ncbi:hypothetical protein HDU98_009165, partial [Podochytrium sp. JEL0797]